MADPLKVLIVDGKSETRAALERLLRRSPGLRVVGSATTAPEALTLANRLCPDIIVYDTAMPQIDNEALVRSLAGMPSQPALVVHASTLSDGEREQWARAGATAFVLKEAGSRGLMACLDELHRTGGGA